MRGPDKLNEIFLNYIGYSRRRTAEEYVCRAELPNLGPRDEIRGPGRPRTVLVPIRPWDSWTSAWPNQVLN